MLAQRINETEKAEVSRLPVAGLSLRRLFSTPPGNKKMTPLRIKILKLTDIGVRSHSVKLFGST
jgi:hypothetical protein